MGSLQARRAVRIGNCSGAACDGGYQMYRQCSGGPIDVVTGDYLAEANLAQNSASFASGEHPGYEKTALDGISMSLPLINEKRIKIIVDGGALNPRGLAEIVLEMIRDQGLDLKVGWVSGDDILPGFEKLRTIGLNHLDGEDKGIKLIDETARFIKEPEKFEVVSAHAYIGARAIKRGLDLGCDIIICGRVSDASPVIGAAWWWHQWSDTDYDQLAGSLVAGHIIECSGYGSGGNFSEFYRYPQEQLLDIGFPIAEIEADGSCVISKHENTRGVITVDTTKCQLLYEIQGEIYLHSDSKADLRNIKMEQIGPDRVRVSGTKGLPPPPTTKAAIFYHGGYQLEYTLNATGYATAEKFQLHEKQIKFRLKEEGTLDSFDVLEFQVVGLPEVNPRSQLRSTTAIRVFGQAKTLEIMLSLQRAMLEMFLQHYSGMHGTTDWRLSIPKKYLAYCPCIVPQSSLKEMIHVLTREGSIELEEAVGSPSKFAKLGLRADYDTTDPKSISTFGPMRHTRLGDIVLGRSGDKGANLNVGFAVREADEWEWLRSTLDHKEMQRLMGDEWDDSFKLERVELPGIKAVHFVIYGILKRGVVASARLDAFGKGFADYIRDRWIDIPITFWKRYQDRLPKSHEDSSL